MTEGVEFCAGACHNLGTCNFFYYDPNDGECVQEKATKDSCPETTRSSNYYMFYRMTEPATPPPEPPVVDLPYTLIGEGQRCSATLVPLAPATNAGGEINTCAGCYEACLQNVDCFLFVQDGNECFYDPEGRFDGCANPDLPMVAGPGNMYNANKPEPVVPGAPAPAQTLIAEKSRCMLDEFVGFFDTVE